MIPHKCPACNGHTTVSKPPHIPGDQQEWSSAGTGSYPCQACKGTGIVWEDDYDPEPINYGPPRHTGDMNYYGRKRHIGDL